MNFSTIVRSWTFLSKLLALTVLIHSMAVTVSAQSQSYSTDGLQPNSTFVKDVSLDSLDIHLAIPVVSKAGVGLPFRFEMDFNNNFYTVEYSGEYNNWVPEQPGGYQFAAMGWTYAGSEFGYFLYSYVTCGQGQPDVEIFYGYVDGAGVVHEPPVPTLVYPGGGTYGNCRNTVDHVSWTTSDGSGLTVYFSYYASSSSVTTPSGTTIIPYYGSASTKDMNSNTISLAGSGNPTIFTYTDTLGVQPELTVTDPFPTGTPYLGCSGTTYTYPTATGTASVTVSCKSYQIQTAFSCPNNGAYWREFNNGGSPMLLVDNIVMADGSKMLFTYESQAANTVTGRLASVTYPSGNVVSYTYTGANHGMNCTNSNGDITAATGTPPGIIRTDADGTWQFTHTFSSNTAVTTVVGPPPANNTTVYTFSVASAAPFQQFLTQIKYNQGSSTLLKTEVLCYNTANPVQANCPTAAAPTIPLTIIDDFTTLAGASASSRVRRTLDNYGNTTGTFVYDFGASTPTRQVVAGPYGYTWNGSTTNPTCTTPIGSSVMDKPCQVQVQNGSGAVLRNTFYQYGTTTNPGSLLSQALLTGGSTYLVTSATYNANGTMATSFDANGNKTTYTQGACNNGFVTKIVPAISTLDTQYTWDCNGATMLSATDANGFPVSTTYNDPLWRATSITDQLNNVLNISYYPTVPIDTQEAQMTFSAGSSGTSDFDVFNTADVLGRPLYAQQIESSGGSWDTTQMGYSWNSTGRVTSVTMPCVAAKGSGCSNGATTITHDALDRPLLKTDGGGGTNAYTYSGSSSCTSPLLGCLIKTTTIGPAPAGEVVKQSAQEYNGLGQLVANCLISSASGSTSCGFGGYTGFPITYSYNSDGTLASESKSSSTNTQIHSFTYDALGRTLTATYPESGTKQFFYDSAPSTPGVACSTTALPTGTGLNVSPLGHLVKTYDADGTTTCLSYDAMKRNTGIAYAGTNWDGENKYFTYDSATVNGVTMTNALGRIAEAYTAPTSSGTKATDEGFSYTARGELSDVYQHSANSGTWYHTTATYAANGVPLTLTSSPNVLGATWSYVLDGKGRPNTATQATTAMVTGVTYNAADQPCLVTLGLGDTDAYSYDNVPCTGLLTTGRMTGYQFSIKGIPISLTGSLAWNTNGTLQGLTVVDGINAGADSEVCDYGTSSNAGYDEVGRLIRVNCWNGSTAVWGQNFTYDAYDNLKKTVPTGQTGTTWTPTYNLANNQYTTATYDSNGNSLTDTFHTYTWNQDNKLKAITDAGVSGILHDAFGRTVEWLTGSTYSQTLISPIGPIALMSKGTTTQYRIPLPGGDTAVNGVNFEHVDRLGNVPFVSSRSRTSVASRLFAPYGESYNNTGITGDLDFTGDRQDLVVGLYDTPNRELNPSGRWISPDPLGLSPPSPTDPKAWNRYAYVGNNPLSSVDPTGLSWCGQVNNPCPTSAASQAAWAEWECELFGGPGGTCGQVSVSNYVSWNDLDLLNSGIPVTAYEWGPIPEESWSVPTDTGSINYRIISEWGWTVVQVGTIMDLLNTYLFHRPWVVSWIVPIAPLIGVAGVGPAGDVEWNPDTHTLCVGIGAGASVGKDVAIGPLTNGTMFNGQTYPIGADNILSGWSVSGGYNSPFLLGGQGMINGSGAAGGPSVGVPGFSIASTYSGCAKLP